MANETKTLRSTDWEAIEADYRAGVKTLREIAGEHGITHGAINKRAKRDGWTRDLSAKIRARAEDLVSKNVVSTAVSKEAKVSSDEAVIAANAQAIADVVLSHRANIADARAVGIRLLAELKQETDPDTLTALQDLGEMLRNPDERGVDKLSDLYRKVISLPGRTKVLRDLGDTLQKLVQLERQAYNMDDRDKGAESAAPRMTNVDRAVRLARLLGGPDKAADILTAMLEAQKS